MSTGDRTLACLSCGKPLFNVTDNVPNQPNDGVVCHTYGNYGSTVFDPMDGHSFLEFNICDACLLKAGETGRIMALELEGKDWPTQNREQWKP